MLFQHAGTAVVAQNPPRSRRNEKEMAKSQNRGVPQNQWVCDASCLSPLPVAFSRKRTSTEFTEFWGIDPCSLTAVVKINDHETLENCTDTHDKGHLSKTSPTGTSYGCESKEPCPIAGRLTPWPSILCIVGGRPECFGFWPTNMIIDPETMSPKRLLGYSL